MILKTRAAKKATPAGTPTKVKYEPNAGEKLLLRWIDALRSGEFLPKLKNPSVALRGKKGEYSVSGVLCELIRLEEHSTMRWNDADTLFKTYTIDGYAFELPIWCISYMTRNGLTSSEVITIVDLCYDLDQGPNIDNDFTNSANAIEKLVRGWIKEKSSDLNISDAEWDEIYLVSAGLVDLTKGKLTATDWKKITQAIKAKSTETTVGTWRGFVGRLAKKLGTNGERAATQFKQVPAKVLSRAVRLGANVGSKYKEIAF